MRVRAISALGLVATLVLGASAAMTTSPVSAKRPTTTTTSTTTTSTTTSTTTTTTVGNDVVVAMIDTGVRATHNEFNYGGPTSTTDQFVGWWDFSNDAGLHEPAIGQTWDTVIADPFDPHGHGTATASLAVGQNAASSTVKKPSLCPGCKLAVAKVGEADGTISGNIAAAIAWARETVHADVISMSIGSIVPLPSFISADVYREARLARQAGILMVVSNGNGFANAGVPGEPGFATSYGNSTDVLGVGADDIDGPTVTTDPEVVAQFFDVPSASNSCDSCYAGVTGTSFSAPYTAGFAAALKQTALDNGRPAGPDYIEKLVKFSARDTIVPPTFEGYGVIDAAQFSGANSHAAAGTLPVRPSPDINNLYVETVQGTLDDVWTDKAGESLQLAQKTFTGTLTPVGTIGPSAPTGLAEGEVFTFKANAGDVVTFDMGWVTPDEVADIDMYAFQSSGDTLIGNLMVDRSNNGAGIAEHIEFVAPANATYTLFIVGWSVVTPQAYTLTTNKALTLYEHNYFLNTYGTGLIT